MGYYLQGPTLEKAAYLAKNHGAEQVDEDAARAAIIDRSKAVVCIKDNGIFECAGYCFDVKEFENFSYDRDTRPTTWLLMDRETVEDLSGFKPKAAAVEGGVL